jgi:hypothetical protein
MVQKLMALIRNDPRYIRRMAVLRTRFGDDFPESFIAEGSLSITKVLELAALARSLGLDRLPAAWLLLLDKPTARTLDSAGHSQMAQAERWSRDARWFYRHFGQGRSLLALSLESHYHLETVRGAVRDVTRLFRQRLKRGRPPREHYGAG